MQGARTLNRKNRKKRQTGGLRPPTWIGPWPTSPATWSSTRCLTAPSVLLTSRILYAVHEFLTDSLAMCSAQDLRHRDQFLHPSGPCRQDRRDLLPAARRHLVPMCLGDLLDQSVGAQQRQQPARTTRLPPVHRRILRAIAGEALPHIAVAEARDQVLPTPHELQQPRVRLTQRVERPIATAVLDHSMTQRPAQFPQRRRRLHHGQRLQVPLVGRLRQ